MTTLTDIYEAGGAEVNEERTTVRMDSAHPLQPFEIIMTVYPRAVHQVSDEPTQIEFDVLLHDEVTFGPTTPMGTPIFHHEFVDTIKMPVSQVRIHKKEECGEGT